MKDYPLAAQYIETGMAGGRAQLEAHILGAIAKSGAKPTLGHDLISRMPLGEIWTTNYDPLLELAMPDARKITSDGDLLDRSAAATRRIIKMHGSVSPDGQSWK